MVDTNIHEHRRYSALLMTHADLGRFAGLERVAGETLGNSINVSVPRSKWKTVRFEYLTATDLYSAARTGSRSRSREGRFPHFMYCAISPTLPNLGSPVMFVASPYIRLLSRLVKATTRALPPPAPRFVQVDMTKTYSAFARPLPGMKATKVTLDMLVKTKDLELVSLTGEDPLRSDLHAAIKKVTAPFALRVDVDDDDGRTRVSADRFGNLWWYLSEEARLGNTFRLVDKLDELGVLKLGRSLPLDKASGEAKQ
jgi:hypothetical protein